MQWTSYRVSLDNLGEPRMMKFIKDYGQFIEVGCTSCGKKHTVQKSRYRSGPDGSSFYSPIVCSPIVCACGITADKAVKDGTKWSLGPDFTAKKVKNRATSVKMLLVIAAVIVMFVSETMYIFEADRAEHSSEQQQDEEETSNAEAIAFVL